jgi:hypothetical protein
MPPKKATSNSTSNSSSTFQIQNFYQKKAVQDLKKPTHNPGFEQHGMQIPFRMVVVGASGSGKTNITMNLLNFFSNTFNDVYLFTRALGEPLYDYLHNKNTDKRGHLNPHVHLHEGLDELNSWDLNTHFKEHGQTLIIFDDIVLEKNQSKIMELFVRGRKLGTGGISLVYLSQSFFKIPKTIRSQLTHCIIRRIGTSRDRDMLMRDLSLDVTKEELMDIYQRCVGRDITNFLMIDLENPDRPFRKNFNEEIPTY